MANKEVQAVILTEGEHTPLIFTNQEKLNCYKIAFKNLLKLLYLIEDDLKGGEPVHN